MLWLREVRLGMVVAAVGAAVVAWACSGVAVEEQPQVRRAAEAGAICDLLDRQVTCLEQVAGVDEPLGGDPALGRCSGFGEEAAGEGAGGPAGVPREVGDGKRLCQVC
jgi:hypothetical protein